MSINIKSERTVASVLESAARTGAYQTTAIEDAVACRLSESDRAEAASAESRRCAAEQNLRELDKHLTRDDERVIQRSEAHLYDDHGLPR